MMATLRGFWMRFTRKSNRLRALNTVSQRIPAGNTRYAGMRAVPLAQIRGSENRLDDFDASFNPLQQHNQDRWLNVAMANLRGVTMPPVELIQLDGAYYVRDGHHRISVARAMGQEVIDAEVSVWAYASKVPVSSESVQGAPQPA
jgi:hypothetical protein